MAMAGDLIRAPAGVNAPEKRRLQRPLTPCINHKCSLFVRALIRIGYKGGMNEILFSIGDTPVTAGVALLGFGVLALTLLLIIAIALLMTLVGLSPALGTFLAGVVLANSEFRHELESDIEPFKGLLLGLFFITVGASIDFALLWANIAMVAALTLGLMAVKVAVLLGLAQVFKLRGTDKWLFALGLAQAGEFGFVLLSFTVQNAVLPADLAAILLLVVVCVMLIDTLSERVRHRLLALGTRR
eukprot:gene13844-18341_t